MEALAGFGTPVAVTSVMLIALGFRPLKAAVLALVANTAPVAFGAMRGIAARVHAAGKKIVGATVLPMCNAAGSAKEQTRLAVNAWIRASGTFDAVLDFDAVLHDPADPTVINPPWDHDCYHPDAAGDKVLGDSIDLSVFGLHAPTFP